MKFILFPNKDHTISTIQQYFGKQMLTTKQGIIMKQQMAYN